ncbi:hypothetical protein N6G95_10970 (plasmid) [Pediococcus inopinatus]|uniref:hypothetical protein n=1 Tax=Pediococcus inopinatus TaxID=114090 RepID=UPI002B260C37|nr:hypothetical protein [Pediococcus inopinatus]WPC20697.1 hypothetical protein N6G95_10970 [Pediococcus inopinatus]
MITPAKSGTYTFKVFKNGKTYRTYRGSGHQFKSFKAGKGGYSVRAYCNKSGQKLLWWYLNLNVLKNKQKDLIKNTHSLKMSVFLSSNMIMP